MKNEPNTYYKKVGRKYEKVEHWELDGYPPGLYLIYNNEYSKVTRNATYYTQVHRIQNLGKWSDLVANFSEELTKKIVLKVDEYRKNNERYSIADIVDLIFKEIADET